MDAASERATKEMIKDPLRFFVILCRLAGHKQVFITEANKALGRTGMVAVHFDKAFPEMVVPVYPRQIQGPKGAILVSVKDPQMLSLYVKLPGILVVGESTHVADFDPLNIADCCRALVNIGLAELPEPPGTVPVTPLTSLAKVKP